MNDKIRKFLTHKKKQTLHSIIMKNETRFIVFQFEIITSRYFQIPMMYLTISGKIIKQFNIIHNN